jgi:hypothetical protein
MATYKIIKGEQKKFDWGVVYKCDLTNETGEVVSMVSIKSYFPNFASLAPGQVIQGTIATNEKGYKTLNPVSSVESNSSGAYKATTARQGGFIAKAQETKRQDIEVAQDNKSESIKTTTSMQLAVQCALAEYAKPNSLDSVEDLVLKHRKFILKNWELPQTEQQKHDEDVEIGKIPF